MARVYSFATRPCHIELPLAPPALTSVSARRHDCNWVDRASESLHAHPLASGSVASYAAISATRHTHRHAVQVTWINSLGSGQSTPAPLPRGSRYQRKLYDMLDRFSLPGKISTLAGNHHCPDPGPRTRLHLLTQTRHLRYYSSCQYKQKPHRPRRVARGLVTAFSL